jgi:hypothetical protein
MENISDYINTKNIKAYSKKKTEFIKQWKIDDLVERAEEEWYSYKEIKKLNPWILWNSLPKWKWALEVYSQ